MLKHTCQIILYQLSQSRNLFQAPLVCFILLAVTFKNLCGGAYADFDSDVCLNAGCILQKGLMVNSVFIDDFGVLISLSSTAMYPNCK